MRRMAGPNASCEMRLSERPFLRERESWKSHADGTFFDLHLYGGGIRGGYFGRTQQRILGKHLVVNLGDQIVLPVLIATPYLAHLNRFDRHFVPSIPE